MDLHLQYVGLWYDSFGLQKLVYFFKYVSEEQQIFN